MPFFVYILQSDTSGRFYCGQTDNIPKRISQHNDPTNTFTRTTKVFQGPWNLVWSRECIDRTEAIKLERKIKSRGIKRFLDDCGC